MSTANVTTTMVAATTTIGHEPSEPTAHHQRHSQAVLFVGFALLLGAMCRYTMNRLKLPVPYTIFLPPLIFESAFAMRWHVLRNLLVQMLILAGLGVIISSVLTATAVHGILPSFSWANAFLLGSIVSATDPVAVVALLKSLGASHKLSTLIEGESLLNDGTALVLFTVFYDMSRGEEVDAGVFVRMLFQLAAGGVALGIAWSMVTIFLVRQIFNDKLAETTLIASSSFLVFYVAEHLCHVSGVLAVVTMAIAFVWIGRAQVTPEVLSSLESFWHILAYIAETLVFVLAGVMISQRIGLDHFSGRDYGMLLVFYLLITLVRSVMVALLTPLLVKTGFGFGFRRGLVLIHGGLRGAVSLGLALIVELDHDVPVDIGKTVLFYTAGIAMLTLLINATTAGWLMRKLGLMTVDVSEVESMRRCCHEISQTGAQALHTLARHDNDTLAVCDWSRLEELLQLHSAETLASRLARADQRSLASCDWLRLEDSMPNTSPEDLPTQLSREVPTPRNQAYLASSDLEDNSLAPAMHAAEPAPHAKGSWLSYFRIRPELPDDPHLQQLRLRFLQGVSQAYEHQLRDGTLSPEAYTTLEAACELAKDRSHKSLRLWADSLQSACSPTQRLNAIIQWLPDGCLRFPFEWLQKVLMRRAIRVARAFVEANLDIMAQFRCEPAYYARLESEVHANLTPAREFLASAQLLYPWHVSHVVSVASAMVLIKTMQHDLDSLGAAGNLQPSEYEAVRDELMAIKGRVLRSGNRFQPPSLEQVLLHSPLALSLDTDGQRTLLAAVERHYLSEGQLCDAQGDIVFILSGRATCSHPGKGNTDLLAGSLWGASNLVQLAEGLSAPQVPPLRAQTACHVATIPRQVLMQLAAEREACVGPDGSLAANWSLATLTAWHRDLAVLAIAELYHLDVSHAGPSSQAALTESFTDGCFAELEQAQRTVRKLAIHCTPRGSGTAMHPYALPARQSDAPAEGEVGRLWFGLALPTNETEA
ncbi:uncharacterized protein MONBRDRAFT_38746 [Monosiga brevicollis MX1]|uniref:Cation/H+ exchanger transmembrane domain-containing protein n=1 Tax=Monosiga brevicollis TaxID=81824 RepID=A9V9W1_MONBE|nr:uncharacterized protein MONBRDRAFT_38746 [Monosiga brevicollis MX1]EDQ85557.1 predicted protein [Monosiga brevicollis MX1]|eukprot:XP_001749506.1 hypothetical protein [Monosiga brevicollis MX1]